MKKTFLLFSFLLFALAIEAQQEKQYTQFMMNDYGFNPAVAGAGNGLYFMVGHRVQWRGFELAPTDDFVNVTKALSKKGYRHYWHGVGAYVEQDKFGVFTNKVAYLSYAIHLKVSPNYRVGFGVAGGVKSVGLSNIVFDTGDPAFAGEARTVIVPDIIPGIYLYSKKFNLAISEHNLYKNKLVQGSKILGTSGVQLLPTTYMTMSSKFHNGSYDFVYIPSIHLQYDFIGIPSMNFNFMTYYKKRVGLGITYRMHDAICPILQVRLYKNLIVGFAYDITISKFRAVKPNTEEIMLGMSPLMSTEEMQKRTTNDCPKFEVNAN